MLKRQRLSISVNAAKDGEVTLRSITTGITVITVESHGVVAS